MDEWFVPVTPTGEIWDKNIKTQLKKKKKKKETWREGGQQLVHMTCLWTPQQGTMKRGGQFYVRARESDIYIY